MMAWTFRTFGALAQTAPVETGTSVITTPAEKAETDSFAQSPQARRRIPLGELASRGSAAAIPALARIMPDAASAGRVDRAAFQSFSR
jgi:hypothetical protein